MKFNNKLHYVFLLLSMPFVLSACSLLDSLRLDNVSDSVDYRNKSGTVTRLDVPPGLSRPDFDDTYALSNTVRARAGDAQLTQTPQALQVRPSQHTQQGRSDSVKSALTRLADGNPALSVKAGFDQTWLQTGTALGRLGLNIINEQRDLGIYSISTRAKPKQEETNFIRRLADSVLSRDKATPKGDIYRIIVGDMGDSSLIVVSNEQGAPLESARAVQVLKRLQSAL